jgi:GH15 family glucan-1,4-alpha-glucosidase
VELFFSDTVYNEHATYLRRIRVKNLRPEARTIKLFFNQQFHIAEASRGDTAYYAPDVRAVVHYKGRRVFFVSAKSDTTFFDDYSIGLLGIEGKEGVWRDAEDGVLSKNGIEHGSVDSAIGLSLDLPVSGEVHATYWVVAGQTFRQAEQLHADVLERGAEHLERTSADFWRAWAANSVLSRGVVSVERYRLFERSLFVIETHVDARGAIIASGDSSILQNGRDTYAYCWPRDATYSALALLEAGHSNACRLFLEFCDDVITDKGYLLHKYRSDHSLGSSWHPWVREGKAEPPIQEDETAMPLLAFDAYYRATHDLEFVEGFYNTSIKRSASFLSEYRDPKTGLPLPSHDLWEERFGVFTYTASATMRALEIAATFAQLLGKRDSYREWQNAADEIRAGIITHLIDEKEGIAKSLSEFGARGVVRDFTVDASSWYGLFRFGVLPIGNPLLEKGYERVRSVLATDDEGGIARYEGDRYFGGVDTGVGNPWCITTLWCAEYEIARAHSREDLAHALPFVAWVEKRASSAGLLAEQYNPRTKEAVSVQPLVWSHAQYVHTILALVAKEKNLAG